MPLKLESSQSLVPEQLARCILRLAVAWEVMIAS